jgi:protein-tyrosine phosphatase
MVTNAMRRRYPWRLTLRRHRRRLSAGTGAGVVVQPERGAYVARSVEGSLGLEKAPNARDLGGYVGAGGRRVRRGILFRADSLHRLSEADLAALGRLRLTSVIDFRSREEVEQVGPDKLPDRVPSRLVSLPLSDPEDKVFASVGVVLGRARGTAAGVDAGPDGAVGLPIGPGQDPAATMRDVYRWFVSSSLARQSCAVALRILADPQSLPLLFHCTAGKDRTGWLSAVILSALGVGRADVLADYTRTNELNQTSNAFLLTVLAERVDHPEAAIPLLEARPEYLEAGLDEAELRFGGMDGYLREGLGLDDDTLSALQSNLLEPASAPR